MTSLISFGQISIGSVTSKSGKIVVGKNKPFGSFHSELSYQTNGSDTVTTLVSNNAKYNMHDLKFEGGYIVMNQLYDVIKSAFTDDHKKLKEYKVNIKLGKNPVTISTYGSAHAMISMNKGYFLIKESQLDKLFGR